jgi:hypothetical protein
MATDMKHRGRLAGIQKDESQEEERRNGPG